MELDCIIYISGQIIKFACDPPFCPNVTGLGNNLVLHKTEKCTTSAFLLHVAE